MKTGCCGTRSSTRLLLLGEIASALPDALRDRYPAVAWRQIRAFRNLAVHKYFSVDWAVVWQISREEVPVLEEQAMDIRGDRHPLRPPAQGGSKHHGPFERKPALGRGRRLCGRIFFLLIFSRQGCG